MAVTHIKSGAVTDRDAVPSVRDTSGRKASGALQVIDTAILAVASAERYSTYQVARVPTNCVLKKFELLTPSQGSTGIYDVGVYYPTGAEAKAGVALDTDGTYGTTDILGVIDADFIANGVFDAGGAALYGIALPGGGFNIIGATPAIQAASAWLGSHYNKELWDALGLSADPGGFFDIVLSLTDEAAGTGAATIYTRVEFVL